MAEYKDDINRELFEQIEAYILNRMDPESRRAFEAGMETDEHLRNEVALQRSLIGAVEVFSFTDADVNETKVVPVKRISRSWIYGAAAAATVLVLLLLRYVILPSPSPERLFAAFFEEDHGLPVVMSSDAEQYDFYDGMVSYKEQDYTKALRIWQEVEPLSDTLNYYMAMAQLNSDNTAAAIEYLQPVATDDGSALQSKAIWYLALACLKQNDIAAATEWLARLPDDENAKRLKAEIENL